MDGFIGGCGFFLMSVVFRVGSGRFLRVGFFCGEKVFVDEYDLEKV